MLRHPQWYAEHQYVVRSRSSRSMLIKTIMFYLELILCHHLQSSPVGSAHTDPSVSSTFEIHPGSVSVLGYLVLSALPLEFPQLYRIFAPPPPNLIFVLGKRKKSDGNSDNLRKKVYVLLKPLLQTSKRFCFCKIWGFHSGNYEEWCLLGCYAM
jgi:hypothetical protein